MEGPAASAWPATDAPEKSGAREKTQGGSPWATSERAGAGKPDPGFFAGACRRLAASATTAEKTGDESRRSSDPLPFSPYFRVASQANLGIKRIGFYN